MAPSAIDETAFTLPESKRPPERTYPPAKIFPFREARFEKPTPIYKDGRAKALQQPPGGAAIVIDNGTPAPAATRLSYSTFSRGLLTRELHRLLDGAGRMVL